MTEFKNRIQIIPTLSRLSPIIISIIVCSYAFIIQSLYSAYLVICFFIMFGSNNILKFIGKSFLGSLGERPSGANSCGIIFDGIKSISYGMPSGHSQIAWAVASYLIVKILIDDVMIDKTDKTDKTNIQNINNIYKIIKSLLFILILFIIASYISYSRVIIEGCHTWMQVIIGGCIGAIMGVSVFVIEKYIFKN